MAKLKMEYSFDNIIGHSRKMREVYSLMGEAIRSDVSVLIQGESGTGKELVAKAIHYNSSRRGGRLVAINCAAIPEGLIESELFGHEKGAFSGAMSQKIGMFEQADGGSVLLDEVSEMSPAVQSKLLRVLQEREVHRVGSIYKDIPIDVRVIATTSKDLSVLMESGKFRKDFFYRVAVFPISLPPLRFRKEDIPLLVEYFLNKHSEKAKKVIGLVSDDALEVLMSYDWPGNVRELENVIMRAMLLEKSEVLQAEFLSLPVCWSGGDFKLSESQTETSDVAEILNLEALEKKAIVRALEKTGNDTHQAAELLGISRSTVYRKMKRYNLLKK